MVTCPWEWEVHRGLDSGRSNLESHSSFCLYLVDEHFANLSLGTQQINGKSEKKEDAVPR